MYTNDLIIADIDGPMYSTKLWSFEVFYIYVCICLYMCMCTHVCMCLIHKYMYVCRYLCMFNRSIIVSKSQKKTLINQLLVLKLTILPENHPSQTCMSISIAFLKSRFHILRVNGIHRKLL